MSDTMVLMALFEDIDPAARGIARLREMGVREDQMNIISGFPISPRLLDRRRVRTHVPLFALGGAAVGLAGAIFFLWGIPILYQLHVGGQPVYPFPPLLVVGFELAMLGLMCAAFLGVLIESRFPSDEPKEYMTEISDGKIAVVFNCPADAAEPYQTAMEAAGAEWTKPVEAKKL
jgi:hypothetical protein